MSDTSDLTSHFTHDSDSSTELTTRLRFLALSAVKGLGPVRLQQLLSLAEQEGLTPEQDAFWQLMLQVVSNLSVIPSADKKALDERLTHPMAEAFVQSWPERDRVVQWLQASDRNHLLAFGQEAYPYLLAQISDPPLLLYLQGDPTLLHRPQLAMVGARKPTAMGLADARAFAGALSELGWAITSGLAEGIDAAAHQGALQANGATLAVLGTGIDGVYPSRHQELQQEIGQRGLLISEYPLGTPPRGANFPKRNRIVSGLSLGLLVVEAALKSGSLISARLASEQGREVFAIPGSIHQAQSKGCHQLIKQGAKLTETVMDIHEELGHWLNMPQASRAMDMPELPVSVSVSSRSAMHQGYLFGSSEQSATLPSRPADPGKASEQILEQGQQSQLEPSARQFSSPEARQIWLAVESGAGSVDELVICCQLNPVVISQQCLLLEVQGYLRQVSGRWQVVA